MCKFPNLPAGVHSRVCSGEPPSAAQPCRCCGGWNFIMRCSRQSVNNTNRGFNKGRRRQLYFIRRPQERSQVRKEVSKHGPRNHLLISSTFSTFMKACGRDLSMAADLNCFSTSKHLKSIVFNTHPSLLAPGWCFQKPLFLNTGVYF